MRVKTSKIKKMSPKRNLWANFWNDQTGGSMIESGLLIALSLILFLMLMGMVTNIYSWIEEQFNTIFDFFVRE